MDLNLGGHVAIVQGASKGIGRGIAEALASEGCNLVLTGRTESSLAQSANEIEKATGRQVVPFVADTSDLDAQAGAVARAVEAFGRLDILVSNSGGPPPGTVKTLESERWIDAARLLIASPAALLRSALPHLEKSPAPRLFVVTSSSTATPIPGLTLSNVYRPGVVGFIKTVTEEFGSMGLCAHSIAPGRFDTERLSHVIKMQADKAGVTPDQAKEAMFATIPAGRLGEPIELGRLVAFLASPLSDYLRGGNWLVDGGLVRVV